MAVRLEIPLIPSKSQSSITPLESARDVDDFDRNGLSYASIFGHNSMATSDGLAR